MAKKNVLGRGLGALIADAVDEPVTRELVVSAMQELNLADIRPNPFQPVRSLMKRPFRNWQLP